MFPQLHPVVMVVVVVAPAEDHQPFRLSLSDNLHISQELISVSADSLWAH